MNTESRTARVFLSSTFRDFAEERDLLVKRVFPALRARLKERFVELVDVDLRWGITAEQAERGEVLPICLAEIDRARPFFIGTLGERYGWVPPAESYPPHLIERFPWIAEHQGGKSVTELEVLHGVLNDPAMAGRAFFYFRSPEYAKQKGGEYLPSSPEDAERLADLKQRIRQSGFPVVEDYPTPETLAKRLEEDLWRALDQAFPADEVPDEFARETARHTAYATARRRLYLGGELYLKRLDKALAAGRQKILIEGASGAGKSALLANWVSGRRMTHPQDLFHEHYLAASADAAEHDALVQRLIEVIRRQVGNWRPPDEADGRKERPPRILEDWLEIAGAYARLHGRRWVIVVDGLNGLKGETGLSWLPRFPPLGVYFVVSCLPGAIADDLLAKGKWDRLTVEPLTPAEGRELLAGYLARYNKVLQAELEAMILSHPLSSNPLFLRTTAEELRVFGVHERLEEHLRHLLESSTIDDMFERVLARVENDNGAGIVRAAMEGISVSRSGLTEGEILKIAGIVPATWAPIRYALDDALVDSGGRLTFGHDYLRSAVKDRYLPGDDDETEAHVRLAQFFEAQAADARAAEEIPHQWKVARQWGRLKACLIDQKMFVAILNARGEDELQSYWYHLAAVGECGQDVSFTDTGTPDSGELAGYIEKTYEAAWAIWSASLDLEKKRHPFWYGVAKILRFLGSQTLWKPDVDKVSLVITLKYFLSKINCRGDFTKRLARTRFDLTLKIYGPKHVETATSCEHLAYALYDVGNNHEPRLPEIIMLLRWALAIYDEKLGPQHSLSISCNVFLGRTLMDAKDFAGAAMSLRRHLAAPDEGSSRFNELCDLVDVLCLRGGDAEAESLLRQEFVDAGRAQISIVQRLADILRTRGQYAEAERLLRTTLLGQRRWKDIAGALASLGTVLHSAGKYDEAVVILRRALWSFELVHRSTSRLLVPHLVNLAAALCDSGDHTEAELQLRRALELCETTHEPNNPETLNVLSHLSELLYKKGSHTEAEALLHQALAISRCVSEPEELGTLNALSKLGRLLHAKGDSAEAEFLLRRVLDVRDRVYWPEHPDMACTLSSLSDLLHAKGEHADAEQLRSRARAIRSRSRGLCEERSQEAGQHDSAPLVEMPEEPHKENIVSFSIELANTLRARNNSFIEAEYIYRRGLERCEMNGEAESLSMATILEELSGLLHETQRYEEAETLLRRALTIRERLNGRDRTETADTLSKLGRLLSNAGKYNEAEPLLRRALAVQETVRGTEHAETADTLSLLGCLMKAEGHDAEAERLLRQALAIQKKVYGPSHAKTADTFHNLGDVLASQRDYTAAAHCYRRALAIRENVHGPEHVATLESLDGLALVLYWQKEDSDAEILWRRLLVIREKVNGPTSTEVGKVLSSLGDLLRRKADYAEAEQLYRRALMIFENAHEVEDASILNILDSLSWLYYNKEEYAEAQAYRREVLQVCERAYGSDSFPFAYMLNSQGYLLLCKKNYAEAEPLLKRALAIREELDGPTHPDTQNTTNHLARLYKEMGNYSEAEALWRRLLVIQENVHGPESPQVVATLSNLTVLHRMQGNNAEVEALCRQALQICEKANGPESSKTAYMLNVLGRHLVAVRRPAEAELLFRRAISISEKVFGHDHQTTVAYRSQLSQLSQVHEA